MFGYIIINQAEMKIKDYDIYHSYYCGLCRTLKERHGLVGQTTLSYDMTFLHMLLAGLYEPQTICKSYNCVSHPFKKQAARMNEYTTYVADMNILLTYYKCKDDWLDEKKYLKFVYAKLLKNKLKKIRINYSEKINKIDYLLKEITINENSTVYNAEEMASQFGDVMAEIFAYKKDEWETTLRTVGFYLGKFIYLMDAYEDIEEDQKTGNYNPLLQLYQTERFEEECQIMLSMMMAESSKSFEQLPILENIEIMRNILYSGVWCRYEMVKKKREEQQVKIDEKSV